MDPRETADREDPPEGDQQMQGSAPVEAESLEERGMEASKNASPLRPPPPTAAGSPAPPPPSTELCASELRSALQNVEERGPLARLLERGGGHLPDCATAEHGAAPPELAVLPPSEGPSPMLCGIEECTQLAPAEAKCPPGAGAVAVELDAALDSSSVSAPAAPADDQARPTHEPRADQPGASPSSPLHKAHTTCAEPPSPTQAHDGMPAEEPRASGSTTPLPAPLRTDEAAPVDLESLSAAPKSSQTSSGASQGASGAPEGDEALGGRDKLGVLPCAAPLGSGRAVQGGMDPDEAPHAITEEPLDSDVQIAQIPAPLAPPQAPQGTAAEPHTAPVVDLDTAQPGVTAPQTFSYDDGEGMAVEASGEEDAAAEPQAAPFDIEPQAIPTAAAEPHTTPMGVAVESSGEEGAAAEPPAASVDIAQPQAAPMALAESHTMPMDLDTVPEDACAGLGDGGHGDAPPDAAAPEEQGSMEVDMQQGSMEAPPTSDGVASAVEVASSGAGTHEAACTAQGALEAHGGAPLDPDTPAPAQITAPPTALEAAVEVGTGTACPGASQGDEASTLHGGANAPALEGCAPPAAEHVEPFKGPPPTLDAGSVPHLVELVESEPEPPAPFGLPPSFFDAGAVPPTTELTHVTALVELVESKAEPLAPFDTTLEPVHAQQQPCGTGAQSSPPPPQPSPEPRRMQESDAGAAVQGQEPGQSAGGGVEHEHSTREILSWIDAASAPAQDASPPAKPRPRSGPFCILPKKRVVQEDEELLGGAGGVCAGAQAGRKRVCVEQERTFDVGDVNRIIAECFIMEKPVEAVKMIQGMRKVNLIPTRGTFDMFQQALHASNASSRLFLEAFARVVKDAIDDPACAAKLFFAAMPAELPTDVAQIASHTQQHALALDLLDSIFAAARRDDVQLSGCDDTLEAYLTSCVAVKKAPMSLDEMRGMSLLPSSPSSELWSLAVSALSRADEPRSAFVIIEYVTAEQNPPGVISDDAESDAIASGICNGLTSLCIPRICAKQEEEKAITPAFINAILHKVLQSAAGRLDTSSWWEILRASSSSGTEPNIETHNLTLHAALAAKDLSMARESSKQLHSAGEELSSEFEQALFDLEEQERHKKNSRSIVLTSGAEGEDQCSLSVTSLTGKDPEQYLRFICAAIGRRKPDSAIEAWNLLMQRCGSKASQELVEPCVFALLESGYPREALTVAQSLPAPPGQRKVCAIAPETLLKAFRSTVTAAPDKLSGSQRNTSDSASLRMRVALLEEWLSFAIASSICSQDMFTCALQSLQVLCEWGEALCPPPPPNTLPSSVGGGGRSVPGVEEIMQCYERMRECSVLPSAEAFGVLITAAGFVQGDAQRVRDLTHEMSNRCGLEVPVSAQEALCAAQARAGDAGEAARTLAGLHAAGAGVSARCLDVVIAGLVSEREPAAALALARALGALGDGARTVILRGFIACGELDGALALHAGAHGAAELPPKFRDLIEMLAGGGGGG